MILQNKQEFPMEYDLPSGFVEATTRQQSKALMEAMLERIKPMQEYRIRWRMDNYEDADRYVQGYKAAMEIDELNSGKWEERETFSVADDDSIIPEWQSARCSACGKYHTTPYMYYFDNFNFCPNCGADMGGEGDE